MYIESESYHFQLCHARYMYCTPYNGSWGTHVSLEMITWQIIYYIEELPCEVYCGFQLCLYSDTWRYFPWEWTEGTESRHKNLTWVIWSGPVCRIRHTVHHCDYHSTEIEFSQPFSLGNSDVIEDALQLYRTRAFQDCRLIGTSRAV